MSIHRNFLIPLWLLPVTLLSGCATTRQIAVDYPKTETSPLAVLAGQSSVELDDYYLQWIAEFDFKGDNALKAGCSSMGGSYEKGDLSAALVFDIHNDSLKFKREASGFLYQATIGQCNFKLETHRAYLTPWLRLDSAKDTVAEYRFLTSNSHDTNLSQLVSDINAASGLLALTGVGTGVAVMGKVAGNWIDTKTPVLPQTQATAAPTAKYSSETHSLPSTVVMEGERVKLNHSRLPVFEVVEGGWSWGSENKLLGEMHVYPEVATSLLLKGKQAGLPDAHDLSLEELWRVPIQSAAGETSLQGLIEQVSQGDKPNLQPDWRNYDDVQTQCRRLKLTMKDLGFNKFDRDAVLFYFLNKSQDWKNFNISAERALADAIRPKVLEQYRSNNFSGCLASEDYAVMKSMKLAVNTEQDWAEMSSVRQKKDSVINSVQAVGRQLIAALSNSEADQMARQLYPLLANDKGGNGSVLLQNHLSNFGLEALLQVPAITDEGIIIQASQLAAVIKGLNVERYSCARPAQEQGQPLPAIGILLFATQPGSPREKGGALEFEVINGKISRLAFQHPSFRDFEQNLVDYPELGGCRIEPELLQRLH